MVILYSNSRHVWTKYKDTFLLIHWWLLDTLPFELVEPRICRRSQVLGLLWAHHASPEVLQESDPFRPLGPWVHRIRWLSKTCESQVSPRHSFLLLIQLFGKKSFLQAFYLRSQSITLLNSINNIVNHVKCFSLRIAASLQIYFIHFCMGTWWSKQGCSTLSVYLKWQERIFKSSSYSYHKQHPNLPKSSHGVAKIWT